MPVDPIKNLHILTPDDIRAAVTMTPKEDCLTVSDAQIMVYLANILTDKARQQIKDTFGAAVGEQAKGPVLDAVQSESTLNDTTTLDFVEDVCQTLRLDDFDTARALNFDLYDLNDIQGAVSRATGVSLNDMNSVSKTRAHIEARQVSLYIAWRLCQSQRKDLADYFGTGNNKAHVSRKKIEADPQAYQGVLERVAGQLKKLPNSARTLMLYPSLDERTAFTTFTPEDP